MALASSGVAVASELCRPGTLHRTADNTGAVPGLMIDVAQLDVQLVYEPVLASLEGGSPCAEANGGQGQRQPNG